MLHGNKLLTHNWSKILVIQGNFPTSLFVCGKLLIFWATPSLGSDGFENKN